MVHPLLFWQRLGKEGGDEAQLDGRKGEGEVGGEREGGGGAVRPGGLGEGRPDGGAQEEAHAEGYPDPRLQANPVLPSPLGWGKKGADHAPGAVGGRVDVGDDDGGDGDGGLGHAAHDPGEEEAAERVRRRPQPVRNQRSRLQSKGSGPPITRQEEQS